MQLRSLGISFLLTATAAAMAAPQYSVLQRIPIGGDGGWDYLTMDSPSHRLYISRGTHVMVLDVNSGRLVGDIANTPGVHGIAIASNVHKGYVSNGRDNTVTVFDLNTFKETARIKVGRNPDAIFYDPGTGRIFTFNGGSADSTAIDPKTDTVLATIKLTGKPEFPTSDERGHIFVNIEDKSQVEQIDARNLRAVGVWPLAPGEEPSGMAIDLRNHLLFSVCSNKLMTAMDFRSGKVVATAPIGNGPDAAAFDPGTGLAFSSNGQDGTLSVVGKGAGGAWTTLATVPTQASARTMAIDPKSHRIYLIAAQFEAPTDPTQRRRRMVPNSTVILVVAPKR